jgi:hypothetical protein
LDEGGLIMKPVGVKAINNFIAYIGGKRSLRTVKKFITERHLYKYRLRNCLEYLEVDLLKQLAGLPCPTTQENLDYSNIRFAKIMRNNLELPEKLTCEKCSFKDSCKKAFLPLKGVANVADLTRFVYSWTVSPPKDLSSIQALESFLNPFPKFIKNLNSFPVPLKRKPGENETQEESEKNEEVLDGKSRNSSKEELELPPIKASKPQRPSSSFTFKRKPPIINDKFKWSPTLNIEAKQQKQERRTERKRLESEVDFLVRKTTKKYSKSKNRPKFKKSKRPSFTPP